MTNRRHVNISDKEVWSKVLFIWTGILICIAVFQLMVNPSLQGLFKKDIISFMQIKEYSRYSNTMDQLSAIDYHQLINLNFNFSLLNLKCNEFNLLLLVLVHSAPKNFAKRKTIRETWGKIQENVKILFMLGTVSSYDLQMNLEKENELHNDLIQGNFLDSYRNMTYKHVMVFKYVIYHCPRAKYVLKADDDVFINMPALKIFLTEDLPPHGVSNLLLCTPRRNMRTVRTYRSKWRVSFSEYSNRKYPTYCPGWALLYSPDVILTLYKEAQRADYFWIDDLYITGILAEKIHLIHTDVESLVLPPQDLHYVADYSCTMSKPFLYGRPNIKEEEIRNLWKFVSSHSTPRSVIKEFKMTMYDFLPFLKRLVC